MIAQEQSPRKTSQFRNVRVATIVPEMLAGIWQTAVLMLVKEFPVCPVTNDYSNRAKPLFVPFVFNLHIP